MDKRNELLAMQNVDVESSFASSRLPEEKRTIDKEIKVNLLDTVCPSTFTLLEPMKTQSRLVTEHAPSENIDSSAQVTENGHDSVIILDVQNIQSQFVSNASDERIRGPQEPLQSSIRSNGVRPVSLFTFNSRTSKKMDKSASCLSEHSQSQRMEFSSNNYMTNFKVELFNY